MRHNRVRIVGTVLGIAGCWVLQQTASALPPELAGYDPSQQVRFATVAQADAKRRELIAYIWPDGLPVNTLPAVARNIGREVFAGDLGGLDGALASAVERLDAEVAPYDFHGISYLLRPRTVNANNRRLVMLNSGHRKDGPFAYGVNDAANRLLGEGFAVLMTDMPLVGFNTANTVKPPDGGATVTIGQRGGAGHNEMFDKLASGKLPGGTIFRLFLEPMVQGVNHFLRTTPDAADVSFVGLSGGGWSAHMLAALDVRIKQSFPVAGSYPLYARPPGMSHDAEQFFAPLYFEVDANGDGIPDAAAGVASWLEIYALGGYGPGRCQIQILNLHDSCCFSGDTFQTYDNFVAGIVRKLGQGEWGFYSDTSHHSHLISPVVLNQVIMPRLLGTADPPPMVPALFATESHVMRFDARGNKTWETASGMSRDVWLLPNGNALFPCNFKPGVEGGVREVAPDGKVVWEFKTEGWVLSCQRLSDGNTLVGAAGQCALLIVDPAGKVVREIKVRMNQSNIHSLTMARQLDNGHFLVVEEELRMVREYRPDGQVAWEVKPPFRPFAVVRVKNGNTFISGQDGIVEVAPDKSVVWQVTREDVKDMGPRWFAGIQIRANGNIVVCNAGGKVPFYELNRDKKVVWQSALPAGQPGLGHGICLLDERPPLLR